MLCLRGLGLDRIIGVHKMKYRGECTGNSWAENTSGYLRWNTWNPQGNEGTNGQRILNTGVMENTYDEMHEGNAQRTHGIHREMKEGMDKEYLR